MKIRPDATLLPRAGDVAEAIQQRIDATLADLWEGAVLEVHCPDDDTMCDLAARALVAGRHIVDPFERLSPTGARLLIENTTRAGAIPMAPRR